VNLIKKKYFYFYKDFKEGYKLKFLKKRKKYPIWKSSFNDEKRNLPTEEEWIESEEQ